MTIRHAEPVRRRSSRGAGRVVNHDRVDVVYNPGSGRADGGRYLAALRAALAEHFRVVRVHEVGAGASPEALARAALDAGATNFVAAGGDGTVAAVAGALRGAPGAFLTVAPRGTANAFAAALALPGLPEAVAAACARGRARAVDVARATTGSFDGAVLLLAGVGLEADAVAATARHSWLKRAFGGAAYALAALRCVVWRPAFDADIVLVDVRDGGAGAPRGAVSADRIALRGVRLQALTVANAAPPTSVLAQGLGPVACDDGLLEVVCVAPRSIAASLVAFADMLRGAYLSRRILRESVFGLRARRVEIDCRPPQRVVVDGEDAGLTPVVVELGGEGSSVQVVAPTKNSLRRRRRRVRRTLERLWINLRGVAVLAVGVWLVRRYDIVGKCGSEIEEEAA